MNISTQEIAAKISTLPEREQQDVFVDMWIFSINTNATYALNTA